jgi:hypothetical protein
VGGWADGRVGAILVRAEETSKVIYTTRTALRKQKIQQEIKHSACRSDNLRYVEKTETSLGNTLRG